MTISSTYKDRKRFFSVQLQSSNFLPEMDKLDSSLALQDSDIPIKLQHGI